VARLARHAGAWLLWATPLFFFWLLLVGEWNDLELAAAASAAGLAAFLAELVRSATRTRPRVPLRLLLESTGTAFAMVFVDFAIVSWVLLRSLAARRRPEGRFVVRNREPAGDDPAGVAQRAFTVFLASLSPNAIVVDVDDEGRSVLLHDLVVHRPSERPA